MSRSCGVGDLGAWWEGEGWERKALLAIRKTAKAEKKTWKTHNFMFFFRCYFSALWHSLWIWSLITRSYVIPAGMNCDGGGRLIFCLRTLLPVVVLEKQLVWIWNVKLETVTQPAEIVETLIRSVLRHRSTWHCSDSLPSWDHVLWY